MLIDRSVPGFQTDLVRCNSESGAYELVKHLIVLGHKRIAAITGPHGVSTSEDRVSGYQHAMSEAGLENLASVYYGAFTQASGYELANQVLAQNPRPTAIFGANNFLSIGILKALRDANLSVPQDMSVVGFDDLPVSLIVDPILTVAAQPAYEMGQQATQLLLKRLTDDALERNQEIILPTELIVRRSSGPPQISP